MNLGLMLVIVFVGLLVIYQWIEAARTVSSKAYGACVQSCYRHRAMHEPLLLSSHCCKECVQVISLTIKVRCPH